MPIPTNISTTNNGTSTAGGLSDPSSHRSHVRNAIMDISYKSMTEIGGGGGMTEWGDEMSTTNRSMDPLEPALASELGKEESRAVRAGKCLVFLVLIVAAIVMGGLTFWFTRGDEKNSFDTAFRSSARELIKVANANAIQTLSIVQSLSTATTSYSNRADLTWPFVTIPDFELRAQEALQLSGAELIAFTPIVSSLGLDAWGIYSFQNQEWITEGLAVQQQLQNSSASEDNIPDPGGVKPYIHTLHEPLPNDKERYAPLWQYAPAPNKADLVNLDLIDSFDWFAELVELAVAARHVVLGKAVDMSSLRLTDAGSANKRIRSMTVYPVLDKFETRTQTAQILGFLSAVIPWDTYFANVLPEGTHSVVVEVLDDCGTEITYQVTGPEVELLGLGLRHDAKYQGHVESDDFASFARATDQPPDDPLPYCSYEIRVYPTSDFQDFYLSNEPFFFAFVVLMVFAFTTAVFVLYDYLVARRQSTILHTAQQTTAVVASLFPQNVQKRILEQAANEAEELQSKPTKLKTNKAELQAFLGGKGGAPDPSKSSNANNRKESPPIADLFPETTILFGDIVGFTAWSSVREPAQVFILLETIYGHFDDIAKKRRVFKVETVGDCYVAVTGLPQARKDHALAMVRFAKECLSKFSTVTKSLEIELGPETGDLNMRIGMHSGPVTAGVLRGDRARFQLFGDTMNTASRMETNGKPGCIHISQETAELLQAAGKSHWLSQREDQIHAKGKGYLTTFWVNVEPALNANGGDDFSLCSSEGLDIAIPLPEAAPLAVTEEVSIIPKAMSEVQGQTLNDKQKRLVDWNTDLLMRLLRKIEARRLVSGKSARAHTATALGNRAADATVLDEFSEIIELPEFDPKLMKKEVNPEDVDLPEHVEDEVREYVTSIAFMYRDNPFHNFEHCSHVAMSVSKLLSRIVAPIDGKRGGLANTLHDHTYGITSDPLTQFACVFSALIHDVDHVGVPNTQLATENPALADRYRHKSIAEQNSVDLAWDLLQLDCYSQFRRCIFKTQSELIRFRHLVVNSVMATDIMDKDLKALRNARWDKAFSETAAAQNSGEVSTEGEASRNRRTDINRKATIVIEHIIQASDVSHTMQHWHIYRKWNQRLFEELYRAYHCGRAGKDPSEFWYKGEIGFFDFYIIPLAKKLKECGVFGVSSFEYLDYAKKNRAEWEARGQELVGEMVQKVQQEVNNGKNSGNNPL